VHTCRFTGREAIAYNRVMRPGSILGPQQQYIIDVEEAMWKAGDPDIPGIDEDENVINIISDAIR
jgi:cell division cycle 14